jgi:dUTP pyrophosphatase
MRVKVKFINDKAKELYLKASGEESIFPFKKYESDFCYDVVATSCTEIAPNVYKYGLGVAFQIDRGAEFVASSTKLSIDFRPRSSVWKTGMVLSNCTGTIDESYTGEVSAIFYHLFPDMPIYKVGDRIGQIKLGMAFSMYFTEADNLDATERGAGGFGSTGK